MWEAAAAQSSDARGASPAVRGETVPPLPGCVLSRWDPGYPRCPRPSDRRAGVPAGRAPPGSALSDSPVLSPALPQRHGLAVCLALTTMCTSLLLVYSSLGGQKERPPQQQQAAATGSPSPHPEAPAGPRPLDGYLGVADHKVTACSPAFPPPSLGIPHT